MSKLKKHLESEIILWNNKFPLDYWWRTKYNIPFGSKTHRDMSFIDMYRDYLEDKMITEDIENRKLKSQGISKKQSQEEIDDDFDKIDLSKY